MLAVKPFKGEVANSVPTGFKMPKNGGKEPKGTLKLKFAHGYRCFDAKNMARFGKKGEIIFTTAAVGVVMNMENNKQEFF